MPIKQLLKAAYELGKADATTEQFQEWYESQLEKKTVLEATTKYVETSLGITVSNVTKTQTTYSQKNVITGGTIICKEGGFHLGDK